MFYISFLEPCKKFSSQFPIYRGQQVFDSGRIRLAIMYKEAELNNLEVSASCFARNDMMMTRRPSYSRQIGECFQGF